MFISRLRKLNINSIIEININIKNVLVQAFRSNSQQCTGHTFCLHSAQHCFAVVPKYFHSFQKDADCNWSEMQMRRQVNVGKCERASPQTDEAKRHKHLWQQIDSQTTTKHIKPSLSLDMEAYLDHIMKISKNIDFILTGRLSSQLTHVYTTG